MTATRRLVGAAVAAAVLTCVLQAQSLGDIARKEEERRKAVAAPGKVYTNDTLRVPPLPAADERPAADRPAATDTAPGAPGAEARPDGAAVESADSGEGPERGETWWRTRAQDQREALRRAELFAESLQTRINALTADFTARDDPAQRDLIALDRQRSLVELDRLREEIAAHRKAIADTEDEARRSGVPPGWLR